MGEAKDRLTLKSSTLKHLTPLAILARACSPDSHSGPAGPAGPAGSQSEPGGLPVRPAPPGEPSLRGEPQPHA